MCFVDSYNKVIYTNVHHLITLQFPFVFRQSKIDVEDSRETRVGWKKPALAYFIDVLPRKIALLFVYVVCSMPFISRKVTGSTFRINPIHMFFTFTCMFVCLMFFTFTCMFVCLMFFTFACMFVCLMFFTFTCLCLCV